MAVLHLVMDHNFINDSIRRFEKYYPGEGLYVMHCVTSEPKIVKNSGEFTVLDLRSAANREKVVRICREQDVKKVVIHGMLEYMQTLIPMIKEVCDVKIYWIFWGYELYETLTFKKGYKVLDERFNPFLASSYFKPYFVTKLVRKSMGRFPADAYLKVMRMVDYFCFWNRSDYDLFQKYFPSKAKYRFFAYIANEKDSHPENLFELRARETHRVLINHQATVYGNHNTVFKKLREVDADNSLEKVCPVSYGFPHVRNNILANGRKYFGDKFIPVEKFMSKEAYYELLDSMDVAIFGQRRQEAAGNISQLLHNGVKVFLRNDNNLLKYFRGMGYLVYSFEDDLNGMEDLKALTLEQQEHNREMFMKGRLYYDDFMPHLLDD